MKPGSGSNPSTLKLSPTASHALHEAIRRRAEEIYHRNGRIPGNDLENWTQAEAEIMGELAHRRARRTAIVIKVNGVQYVGEYNLESAAGYSPGEFSPGESTSVRFDGDRMFVRRPNGTELETTVVEKIG